MSTMQCFLKECNCVHKYPQNGYLFLVFPLCRILAKYLLVSSYILPILLHKRKSTLKNCSHTGQDSLWFLGVMDTQIRSLK